MPDRLPHFRRVEGPAVRSESSIVRQPLLTNLFVYRLVLQAENARFQTRGLRLPCLLSEALWLAASKPTHDEVREHLPHLVGLRDLFQWGPQKVLWIGHSTINLQGLLAANVSLTREADEEVGERIGISEHAEAPYWALEYQELVTGTKFVLPFYGGNGLLRTPHEAGDLWIFETLHAFPGVVFDPTLAREIVFRQLNYAQFMELQENQDASATTSPRG